MKLQQIILLSVTKELTGNMKNNKLNGWNNSISNIYGVGGKPGLLEDNKVVDETLYSYIFVFNPWNEEWSAVNKEDYVVFFNKREQCIHKVYTNKSILELVKEVRDKEC